MPHTTQPGQRHKGLHPPIPHRATNVRYNHRDLLEQAAEVQALQPLKAEATGQLFRHLQARRAEVLDLAIAIPHQVATTVTQVLAIAAIQAQVTAVIRAQAVAVVVAAIRVQAAAAATLQVARDQAIARHREAAVAAEVVAVVHLRRHTVVKNSICIN